MIIPGLSTDDPCMIIPGLITDDPYNSSDSKRSEGIVKTIGEYDHAHHFGVIGCEHVAAKRQ